MRLFIYVMFLGSCLSVVLGVVGLAIFEFPHEVKWYRYEFAYKIIFAVCFMLWEAWLLWGAQ